MTSPASKLLPHREQILSLIADSTGLVPFNADVAACVTDALDLVGRKVASAAAARLAYQQRIDDAVLQAMKSKRVLYGRRELVGWLRLRFENSTDGFGLGHTPCDRTIRASLNRISTSESEVPHSSAQFGQGGIYCSSGSTCGST
jgi:hypothetical protein